MIERSFGNWSRLALIPLWLLASTALSGFALAAQEAVRFVDLKATIEPGGFTLEKKRKFRPKNPVIRLYLRVIPDKRLPDKAAREFARLFSKIADAVNGSHPRADGTVSPKALQIMPVLRVVHNKHKGARAVVDWSFRNDPGLARRLKARGFRVRDTKTLPYKKKKYKFLVWIGDNREEFELGGANATLKFKADPRINDRTSAFRANFRQLPGAKISTEGIPRGGKGRKLSRAAYDDFRQLVNGKVKKILEHLNRQRTALKASELIQIARSPDGSTLRFTRRLKIKWFGAPKTFKVHITATVGATRIVGYPDTSDRDFADWKK